MRKKLIDNKIKDKKVVIKYKTVVMPKKKFPAGILVFVILVSFLLLCLTYSYSVLNEKNMEINKLKEEIAMENQKNQILIREFELISSENIIKENIVN